MCNERKRESYTLPATKEACTEHLRALFLCKVHPTRWILNCVLLKEPVEFRNHLLELPEHKERAILGPGGTLLCQRIALLSQKQNARGNNGETGLYIRREAFDERLAEAIEETKVCSCQMSTK
jgi:hypothetical protein